MQALPGRWQQQRSGERLWTCELHKRCSLSIDNLMACYLLLATQMWGMRRHMAHMLADMHAVPLSNLSNCRQSCCCITPLNAPGCRPCLIIIITIIITIIIIGGSSSSSHSSVGPARWQAQQAAGARQRIAAAGARRAQTTRCSPAWSSCAWSHRQRQHAAAHSSSSSSSSTP